MNILSKKHIKKITGLFVCSTFLVAAPLVAVSGTITTATGNIPDADGGGPGIDVQLSPGVHLGYTLEANGTSFAINSQNSSVDFNSGNRNEYGIASDYTGYYMRPANADTLAAPTADDSAAFSSYTEM